jgi:hypothetical protein
MRCEYCGMGFRVAWDGGCQQCGGEPPKGWFGPAESYLPDPPAVVELTSLERKLAAIVG